MARTSAGVLHNLAASVLFFTLFAPTHSPNASTQATTPDDVDLRALQVSEGIVQLFKQMPDSVWPGYDLASQPFIVYRPGKWALLMSYLGDAQGFSAYPSNWPDLRHPARFHSGEYENLVGQLIFDFPLDGDKAVAVGIRDSVPALRGYAGMSFEAFTLGYIVHEAFHQHQGEAFGEIPWEREERYPMLNGGNTALAALETRLLMDALKAARAGDMKACINYTRKFAAVRKHRWDTGSPFVRRFEQGLELKEGTAQYVQVRALELVKALVYDSKVRAGEPLSEKLGQLTAVNVVLRDFETRMTAGSVSPEDMPRNRIYAVGSAQGLLLDFLGVDWKDAAQRAGPDFTFVDLLMNRVAPPEGDQYRLLEDTKAQYGYDRITASTDSLAAAYDKGYSSAMKSFLGQSGERLEIITKRSGVSRSRVSSERKWLMNSGRHSLCLGYEAYALKGKDLFLQITDSGVLEENDWEAGSRTIIVYPRGVMELRLDGESVALEFVKASPTERRRTTAHEPDTVFHLGPGESLTPGSDSLLTLERDRSAALGRGKPLTLECEDPYYFDNIELTAENLTFRYTGRGGITLSERQPSRRVVIDLRGQ